MPAPIAYFHEINIELNGNLNYTLTLTGEFSNKAEALAALQHLSMEDPE